MIAKFAKKINEILIQKGIVQKEDAELYQYGIENGIVVAGNLLASGIFGIVTGRPGLVLVFLLFYASLRSYSGGSHCKSRIGCFLISMAIRDFIDRSSCRGNYYCPCPSGKYQ